MKISKSDFKIIFNKIINNSKQENLNLLQNISNNSISGDNQIDQLIGNYSSEYISKTINKILNNNIVGGQTSEEETNKNTSLINLGLSETSIEPPKSINIEDMTGGIFFNLNKPEDKKESDLSKLGLLMNNSKPPTTSSEPTSPTQRSSSWLNRSTSPTSSESGMQLQRPLSPTSSEPTSPTQRSLYNLFKPSNQNQLQNRSPSPTSSESGMQLQRSLSSTSSAPTSPTQQSSRWLNRSTSPTSSESGMQLQRPLSSTSSAPTSPTQRSLSSWLNRSRSPVRPITFNRSPNQIDNRTYNINQTLHENQKKIDELQKSIQNLMAEINILKANK